METERGNGFPARVERCFGERDAAIVLRAYGCALDHSGSDAENHAHIADILLAQRADPVVVTAALLAPLHRRGDLTSGEIKSLFGEAMSNLVERSSSDHVLRTDTEAHRMEDLRRWLKSISADVRTLVLRVALRLGALEELVEKGHDQESDQKEVARETLELYVPLADRMSMGSLRTRLEDACFRILQPTIYAEVKGSLQPIREGDQICLSLLKDGVRQLLDQQGIKATIHGRTKGLYSLYQKMCRLDSSLKEIMDRIGLRVIVPSVKECYTVLDLLHTSFRPIAGTFDDYIKSPKKNGYQSLHTCVYPIPDASIKPVEFQIRTEAMHRKAEYGIAAHWLYKNESEAKIEGQKQLEWLRSLLPSGEENASHAEFVDHLHQQVYGNCLDISSNTRTWLYDCQTVDSACN